MMRSTLSFDPPAGLHWPTETPFHLKPPTRTLVLFVQSVARVIFLASTLIKACGSSIVSHSLYPNMFVGLDGYSLELARQAEAVYTNSKR